MACGNMYILYTKLVIGIVSFMWIRHLPSVHIKIGNEKVLCMSGVDCREEVYCTYEKPCVRVCRQAVAEKSNKVKRASFEF